MNRVGLKNTGDANVPISNASYPPPPPMYYAFLYFVPSCFHGYDSITGAKINEMKKMVSLSFTIICLV